MMPSSTGRQRLYSLDALRGFDMFWIIGGEHIFHALHKATGSPFWEFFANQFSHPDWHGFRVYDLIFPLFLFIAGVATPYSIGREIEKGTTRSRLMWRVTKRGLILIVLGIVYNNGLNIRPVSDIRFPSVLGRIGLAYLLANMIYLNTTTQRSRMVWFIGLLTGYWLILLCTAAPVFPPGDLTMEGNFASWVDRSLLPGKLYLGIHDPEGLFATLPAVGTGLLGIITGSFLKDSPLTQLAKVKRMLLVGFICLILAQAWNLAFPINKNLWTSSFVLQTGGLSLLLLAAFYFIIDVKGYRKWAFFFTVIGMNSILIYMSDRFIDWGKITHAFFEWLLQLTGKPYDMVVFAGCVVLVKWLLVYFLFKHKTFLRV